MEVGPVAAVSTAEVLEAVEAVVEEIFLFAEEEVCA